MYNSVYYYVLIELTCEGMLKAFYLLVGGCGFAAVHYCRALVNLLQDAGQV